MRLAEGRRELHREQPSSPGRSKDRSRSSAKVGFGLSHVEKMLEKGQK